MLRIVRACTVGSCLLIIAACGGGGTSRPSVTPGASVGATMGDQASRRAASVTTAYAGNFTPGMRVLIHGYDQQFAGYPPNLRYFEYKTVLTADAGTGIVTFTEPLAYGYDSRWWDTPNYSGTGLSFGAPRIL